jgi:hypothetical protein
MLQDPPPPPPNTTQQKQGGKRKLRRELWAPEDERQKMEIGYSVETFVFAYSIKIVCRNVYKKIEKNDREFTRKAKIVTNIAQKGTLKMEIFYTSRKTGRVA